MFVLAQSVTDLCTHLTFCYIFYAAWYFHHIFELVYNLYTDKEL